MRVNATHDPIFISEASDSAFATRLRQVVSANPEEPHLPRTSFPSDEHLALLSETSLEWPSLLHAQLLVDAAVKCLGRCYHLINPAEILDDLEHCYADGTRTVHLQRSRLLAVFAIGSIYTTRTSVTDRTFPGLTYFAHASKMLRLTPERPSLTMVETQLLLVCHNALSHYKSMSW